MVNEFCAILEKIEAKRSNRVGMVSGRIQTETLS